MTPKYQGACLYTPATHPRLSDVLEGRIKGLRTVVLDLEDGLSPRDSNEAMGILKGLRHISDEQLPVAYVRPRSPEQMREMMDWGGAKRWTGFVLPKLSVGNVDAWLRPLEAGHPFRLMPVLETRDIFFEESFLELCSALERAAIRERIDAVRLGGVDLLAVLGLRHPRRRMIHHSILGPHISFISATLMAKGFAVTAPVCEILEPEDVLREEVAFDVESGFVGKTAVTPRQAEIINDEFSVTESEMSEATKILESSDAVFLSRGAMCEKAPHIEWALRVQQRLEIFGCRRREAFEE